MERQENGSIEGRKGCGFMQVYPVIDVQETGRQLRAECERRQVTPKELQEFLGLAALQSIYSWFQGRTLPSLDNFYALSCYLGIRMEELVVPKRRAREVKRVGGATLPVGFTAKGAEKAVTRLSLQAGDTLLMASDGIGDEKLLRQHLASDQDDPQLLARTLLGEAAKTPAQDDMTVIVVKVETRE